MKKYLVKKYSFLGTTYNGGDDWWEKDLGIIDETQLDDFITRLTTVCGYAPVDDSLSKPFCMDFKFITHKTYDTWEMEETDGVSITLLDELSDLSTLVPSLRERGGNYKKIRNGEWKIE